MRNGERVTFGGSGLDRAAQLRGDEAALLRLRGDPNSAAIALWRGKPLLHGPAGDALVRLPLSHPVLGGLDEPLFLGIDQGCATFAFDLSAWQPDDVDDARISAFLDPTRQIHPELGTDMFFGELRAHMTLLGARDAELAATAKAMQHWHRGHRFCARCGTPSKVVDAGWQRRCLACGAAHFPRTDPVVIMLVTQGNAVLLGRSHGWPESMFSLLAGFVEPGETIEAAVRRETLEETGVELGHVSYLASQPWAFPMSLMIGCRAEARGRQLKVDPAELEDARWVSRERLVDAFTGEDPHLEPARPGSIAHFLLSNWLADTLD